MAFSHIVSTAAESSDNNSVTTSAINTSGADFLVAEVADFQGVTATTFSDSKGNTWNELTEHTSAGSRSRIFWSEPTSVGAGHTFTATGTGAFPSVAVSAFSGSNSSPFDQQNGNAASGGITSIQTGSVTPGQDNELIIAGVAVNGSAAATLSIDLSFTIGAQVTSDVNIGAGIAYLIETSAASKNPTWTFASAVLDAGASIATFKASGGGAANNTRRSQFMLFFPPTTR